MLCHTENHHFCNECSNLWHTHPSRADHDLEVAHVKMQLVSVICKDISHYVCFNRVYNGDQWLFFDSMAERKGTMVIIIFLTALSSKAV